VIEAKLDRVPRSGCDRAGCSAETLRGLATIVVAGAEMGRVPRR